MNIIHACRPGLTLLATTVAIVLIAQSGRAAVKTRIDFDKEFDFSRVRTWAWNTREAGRVLVARTPQDDPEDIQKRVEPIVMDAVAAELPKRGLTPAAGTPDVQVTYYVLLTLGSSAQTLGQFLPPVTQWGVPPFNPQTTSLEVIEQGSLVLDLHAGDQIVWRGIGSAQIKMGLPQEKRVALIREAVRDIVRRYPPKK